MVRRNHTLLARLSASLRPRLHGAGYSQKRTYFYRLVIEFEFMLRKKNIAHRVITLNRDSFNLVAKCIRVPMSIF